MTADLDHLKNQVMATGWSELAQHFARGALLVATSDQDLLAAASAIASDDTGRVEDLLQRGLLRRASDDDAHRWNKTPGIRFQCLVLQPFVLTQVMETPEDQG